MIITINNLPIYVGTLRDFSSGKYFIRKNSGRNLRKEFIYEHRDFYRIALKTRKEFPLKQGFDALWKQIIKPLCLKTGITSENEMMYYFVGFQACFTMILKHWVEQGCMESEEKIAQIIYNTIPAVWKNG